MDNIRLVLVYDGTAYFGWQKTEFPSIEEELEKAFFQIFKKKCIFQAASRTDKGVHANGQVVNLFLDNPLSLDALKKMLNFHLPKDIRILSVNQMPETFHPTLDSTGKEYRYYLYNGLYHPPHLRFSSWHYPYPIDRKKMEKSTLDLIGSHDFSAFCNIRTDDAIRTIFSIDITQNDDLYLFTIQGNRFLYKMVRNIVGTLAYIGSGKIIMPIKEILLKKDRTLAGMTAPATGLFLEKVFYSNVSHCTIS